MLRKQSIVKFTIFLLTSSLVILTGCKKEIEKSEVNIEMVGSAQNRSAEPKCLTPVAGGAVTYGDEELTVDATNASEGYFYVIYSGENNDIKIQISASDSITYTYKVFPGETVIPLPFGPGEYSVIAYEGLGNGMYATKFAEKIPVDDVDEFLPYLYPNYYVNFSTESESVKLGRQLAEGKTCDIEVIAAVYGYVIDNIDYDYDKAANVQSDYIPDVDRILADKKGICFDYAALMAAMLRSQRIPTRLEVGYAGDAYHAWITTYIEDKGWIGGVIEFDGTKWTLMDPTFAANSAGKEIEEFIGDGENYTSKYIY